jgi:hypothetical protein
MAKAAYAAHAAGTVGVPPAGHRTRRARGGGASTSGKRGVRRAWRSEAELTGTLAQW